jgi:hypothetical protein
MELRLPNAPERYDFQNEAQLRRSIEAFARRPLTLYSENNLTARIEGTGLELYSTLGPDVVPKLEIFGIAAGYTVPSSLGSWTGSTLALGRQDNANEGGQIDFLGGGGGGVPYKDWHLDSWQGVIRLFENGLVRHLFDSLYATHYNAQVGDVGHGVAWAGFSHNTLFNTTKYALLQSNVGDDTRLNVGTGGSLRFCFENVEKLSMTATNFMPLNDAAYDIGAATNRRFKDVWITGAIKVNDNNIISGRRTGWAIATGTATRTTFDTATVTLPLLAQRVKALIDDLHITAGHGLIGA